MAINTDKTLQNQMIYSIYVRNHTEEGTFKSVVKDLDRIKALGTDIIWFLPIHPIGEKGKKGTLGCPYANKDYRSVNPAYGTMGDFKNLVEEIHNRGMKCMIDVVYNHTSPDSALSKEHPEFFYRTPEGKFGNKVGDWSDVIDLDYSNKDLWNYQIESLKQWAAIVDGFRCDVASFVPVEFWKQARDEVAKVNPKCIWLAESVHMGFGNWVRMHGIYSSKDYELFDAFDMEYEYDIREIFDRYLKEEIKLSEYLRMINFQEAIYPDNYNKIRFLENHDQPRIASFVSDTKCLENYLAFLFFNKGTTLIYAGQEYADEHLPSLFEKEVINRHTGIDFSSYIAKLTSIKKEVLDCEDSICANAVDSLDIAYMERQNQTTKKIGVFSLKAKSGAVHVDAPDGIYENLLTKLSIEVKDNVILCNGEPIIFEFENVMTANV